MNQQWEDKFRNWAKPPSEAEEKRCENTLGAIREAIQKNQKLNTRSIRIFSQGSYRNNTNVRRESDVDIGVTCTEVFYEDYPEGMSRENFGNVDSGYSYSQFKTEVGEALISHFGAGAVTRGNKAFDVRETQRQVEADVVPFFQHRRYSRDGRYLEGVELRPDNGRPQKIINWPEQHYENGVAKNNQTGKRYKALIRVLKSLRNEMDDGGKASAGPIIGFLCECLMWNVPDSYFGNESYWLDLRGVLVYLYEKTQTDVLCQEWGEVSELKYLFNPLQKWTRQQANTFIVDAWAHVGFA